MRSAAAAAAPFTPLHPDAIMAALLRRAADDAWISAQTRPLRSQQPDTDRYAWVQASRQLHEQADKLTADLAAARTPTE